MAYKINGLKYPATDRIKSRNTTLNRSMANTLMHRLPCSQEIEEEWMRFFPSNTCAYCGKPATHLDHLYSLIDEKNEKRPSGYGTEPGNLVPCCPHCNQPKGKMDWEAFMRSEKCKHVGSVKNPNPILAMEERLQIIKDFQKCMPAKKMSFTPSMMGEWDKLVVDFEIILKNVEEKLNVWSEQLCAGLNSVQVVSTKSKNASLGSSSKVKAKKSAKRVAVPNIVFNPSDIEIFKNELMLKKKAEETWEYSDGTKIVKIWNAKKITSSSNILANIKSKKEWREKDIKGLVKVSFRIL